MVQAGKVMAEDLLDAVRTEYGKAHAVLVQQGVWVPPFNGAGVSSSPGLAQQEGRASCGACHSEPRLSSTLAESRLVLLFCSLLTSEHHPRTHSRNSSNGRRLVREPTACLRSRRARHHRPRRRPLRHRRQRMQRRRVSAALDSQPIT
jgi:hypothetical protein